MKEVKVGKHLVKMYDSIEDLPIVRHHKFSKLMLIDAHIGSDIADFDAHLERVLRYMRNGKNDLAEKELLNLRQNIFFIQTEMSPKHLAFASLIYSVDGEENTDLSDAALKKVLAKLSDVSQKEVDSVADESKKKLDDELQVYFPKLLDNATVKEYYDKLKNRALLTIKKIVSELSGTEEEQLAKLTDELILFSDPQTFSGPESLEIQQDKQFENACLAISQHTHTDPKKFTVLEYYNALFFIQEQSKVKRKGNPKQKGA